MATRLEKIAASSGSARTDSAREIEPHQSVSRPAPPRFVPRHLASGSTRSFSVISPSAPYFSTLSEWRSRGEDALIDSWTTNRAACPQFIVPTELVVRVSCGAGRNDTRHNNERKAHSATE